jgi:hypothetical protein
LVEISSTLRYMFENSQNMRTTIATSNGQHGFMFDRFTFSNLCTGQHINFPGIL